MGPVTPMVLASCERAQPSPTRELIFRTPAGDGLAVLT
jgi:hypothetical protein